MAAKQIICRGKIEDGIITMNIALAPINRSELQGEPVRVSLDIGRTLYEAGFSRSECHNQDEEAGWDEAAGSPVEGWLQTAIDYAAELEELREGIEDVEFWRSGQW